MFQKRLRHLFDKYDGTHQQRIWRQMTYVHFGGVEEEVVHVLKTGVQQRREEGVSLDYGVQKMFVPRHDKEAEGVAFPEPHYEM